jgi:hypothetical protein
MHTQDVRETNNEGGKQNGKELKETLLERQSAKGKGR